MTNPETQSILASIRGSQLLRVLLIAFLILLLQIPLLMIRGTINERARTKWGATADVTAKWGNEQSVVGPYLIVPYEQEVPEKTKYGESKIRVYRHSAAFLPEKLEVSGKIDSVVRHRGIFEVPVYRMSVDMRGEFAKPDFTEWQDTPEKVLWDQAYLSVQISDARAIMNHATLDWNGKTIPFLPGPRTPAVDSPGIHAPLSDPFKGDRREFSFRLELNGSTGAFFVPFGRETKVDLESDWPHPSFQGNWLPSEYTVGEEGFRATWNIPFLGRNYPQQLKGMVTYKKEIDASKFGVNLITPVDHYRMAQRSVKYAVLFLLLTFAALWLFEVLAKVRIHSLQYLLVGGGMGLFYLLELSLAEHIGFAVAYVIASAAVVALIWGYCAAILKGSKRAAVIGSVVALLYGYLYVLLMNQDHALLAGSVGLFLILATVMYLTRKVDWYDFKK